MIRNRIIGKTVVYAGPAADLAALALEYADGTRGPVEGARPCHFQRVAQELLNGAAADSAGTIEFWADRADGGPFHGPWDKRPEPDPQWLARPENKNYRARPPLTQSR